ncbi:MAG: zinc-ribbon domain-containing protein, partial [Clostridia bacterium]|nr:zinc-ribbon domain-containing protein [Clostridia bacterium]
YHIKRTKKDEEKKADLTANGIKLITVKCGRERDVTDDTIVMETKYKANPSLRECEWAIKESFSLLSIPKPDIDLKRDLSEIYALYIRSIKENNISSKYPEIAADWNYELNKGLTPEMFSFGSNKKVWWTCKVCGNDYDMIISHRTNNMGCPYCVGKRIKAGFNDLATTHPQLLSEWDYDKNILKPEEIGKGSDKKVWWKCRICGYEWEATISSRSAGCGCPACAGRTVVKGFNDFETLNPDAAALWNFSLNKSLPSDYTQGSNTKVWWLCPDCGHEWQTAICSISTGGRCPECAKRSRPIERRKTLIKKQGSLAVNYPELIKEWDHSKNILLPEDCPCGTEQKVWWICPDCGHSYETSVYCRVMKHGCPECGKKKNVISAQKKRLADRGSLVDNCPEILNEWDYDKNERGPETYTKGSKAKVWWKCSKGHSWQASIRTRTVPKCGCPACAGKVKCMNVETGEIFDNYTAAAKSVGVTRKAITFAIKHGRKSKGYHWKAVDTN